MKQDPKRQPAAGVFCCRLWASLDYVRLESIYFLLTITKMKAVNPPNLKDILSENFDEIAQYLPHAKPTDHKGRYLPWAEFKHRYKLKLANFRWHYTEI